MLGWDKAKQEKVLDEIDLGETKELLVYEQAIFEEVIRVNLVAPVYWAIETLASVAALEDAPFTVGFAAETENVRDYARGKLENKKLDMIVANRVGADCGFDYDDNAAELLWNGGDKVFAKMPKSELAAGLMDVIAARYFETRGADTQPALSIVSAKE